MWRPDPASVVAQGASAFLKKQRLPLRSLVPESSQPVSLQITVEPALWSLEHDAVLALIESHRLLPNQGHVEIYIGIDSQGLVEEMVLSRATEIQAFNQSLLRLLRKRLDALAQSGQGVIRIEWALHRTKQTRSQGLP